MGLFCLFIMVAMNLLFAFSQCVLQWILGLPRQGRLGWERAPVSSGYGMPIHGLADQFFGYLSMFIFSSILFLFRPV